MAKPKPKFDPRIKLKLARMAKERRLSVLHVSNSVNVEPTAIRCRVEQHKDGLKGQTGTGNTVYNLAATLSST